MRNIPRHGKRFVFASLLVALVALDLSGCRRLAGRFGADGDGPGGASGSTGATGGGGNNGNNDGGSGVPGDGDGDGIADFDDNGCFRTTCASVGATCGTISDGCGGTIDCTRSPGGAACTGGLVCDAVSRSCVVCVPKTCASTGKTCGTISDGCGGTIDCTQVVSGGAPCPSGTTCGGGGNANVCGCRAATCAEIGAQCGNVPDGCGGTLDCSATSTGGCAAGQVCDPVTYQCFFPDCEPKTCADLGNPCGPVSDGCGRTINCAVCAPGTLCDANTRTCLAHPGNGGANGFGLPSAACGERECGKLRDSCGVTHDCGAPTACSAGEVCRDNTCTTCQPLTVCPPRKCGVIPNGCGGSIVCGNAAQSPPYADVCEPGEVCDQIRTECSDPNPTTCVQQGKNCGFISDGLGNTISCGTCTAPETCSGAGVSGVCGLNAANRACLAAGIQCGTAEDACGNDFVCGSCDVGQKCTAGQCEVCPPLKTCADYPNQCGAALSDGCTGTINCSNNCPAVGYECNTTSGQCEQCQDPCLPNPDNADPNNECDTVMSCGLTHNTCGTKNRCGQTYSCGNECAAGPGAPGGVICLNNQCCRRDSVAETCQHAAANRLCGPITDNCGIQVTCACAADTPSDDFACTASGTPRICVDCNDVCLAQNRECGVPTGTTPDSNANGCDANTCGDCSDHTGTFTRSCSSGVCCNSCANRYYGQTIDLDGPGFLPAEPQCGVQVSLDPGGGVGAPGTPGNPVCANGNCNVCPAAGDICACGINTDPATSDVRPCASPGDNGSTGACLSCEQICSQYRKELGDNEFCGAVPGFTGANACACDSCSVASGGPGGTDVCYMGSCCTPEPAATTCRDGQATELCGTVTNNCGQPVNCACPSDAPGADWACYTTPSPDECTLCAGMGSLCMLQNRECGVPSNQSGCQGNACGTCSTSPQSSCTAQGQCCMSCAQYTAGLDADPDGSGTAVSGNRSRCGVVLPRDPGNGGPTCSPATQNCLSCGAGLVCTCDPTTDPHTCASSGDNGELGFCLSCADRVALYRALPTVDDNYCGPIPGGSCTATCDPGFGCQGNVCTPCGTVCTGRECGTVNGCSCGTCAANSTCQNNTACCATCNTYYSQDPRACGTNLPSEIGEGNAAIVCTAGTLNCTTCPGGVCDDNVDRCVCSPEPVDTTCGPRNTVGSSCDTTEVNNCGTNVSCGACGGSMVCVNNLCCQPESVATTCGGSGGNNSICEPRINNCGQTVNCACTSGGDCVSAPGTNSALCCLDDGVAEPVGGSPDRCCVPRSTATACGGSGGVGTICDPGSPGIVSDGCGGQIDCPNSCNGGLVCQDNNPQPDRCCQPIPKDTACGGASGTLGTYCGETVSNGCGGTYVCDACSGPNLVCENNSDDSPPTLDRCCSTACTSNDCGMVTKCEQVVDCSAGAGNCPGVCNPTTGQCCTPRTYNAACNGPPNQVGSFCGPTRQAETDLCGGTIACGPCQGTLVCNGGSCCQPRTCAATNACGMLSDNCGGTITCGCFGLRSCSAASNGTCQCPDPDAAGTLPNVMGFCSGACGQEIWLDDANRDGNLEPSAVGVGCKVNCNDCGGGGN